MSRVSRSMERRVDQIGIGMFDSPIDAIYLSLHFGVSLMPATHEYRRRA